MGFNSEQISIELSFARPNTQAVKSLLDEPVRYLGVAPELAGEGLIARTERAAFLADKEAGGNARFAPGAVKFHRGLGCGCGLAPRGISGDEEIAVAHFFDESNLFLEGKGGQFPA